MACRRGQRQRWAAGRPRREGPPRGRSILSDILYQLDPVVQHIRFIPRQSKAPLMDCGLVGHTFWMQGCRVPSPASDPGIVDISWQQ
jgi:hypothetical protein